jgi:hypothetical protein
MANDPKYRINSPPITHQLIEGEVILVNVETGVYYSLRDAAEIWSLVERGARASTLVAELAGRYAANTGEIEAVVGHLLEELQQEGILCPDPDAGNGHDRATSPPAGTPSPAGTPKPALPRPVLEKYTDMKDILQLDPIHEVDVLGWPVA